MENEQNRVAPQGAFQFLYELESTIDNFTVDYKVLQHDDGREHELK